MLFEFWTSVPSVQLTGARAATMAELHAELARVDEAAVFHHTFQSYRVPSHFTGTYHSDFACWIGEMLRENVVAERIEALDLRDFGSLQAIRESLLEILDSGRDSSRWNRPVPSGMEFHFCRSVSMVFRAGERARNAKEFVASLRRVDLGCLFYHLVEAPLRASGGRKCGNDFSRWFESLASPKEAAWLAGINPFRQSLAALREQLIATLSRGRMRQALDAVISRQALTDSGLPVGDWLERWRRRGGP